MNKNISNENIKTSVKECIKAVFPKIKIYSVEPKNFNDTELSLKNKKIIYNKKYSNSICDALLAPRPGKVTFPINKRLITKGISVTDQQVKEAIIFLYRKLSSRCIRKVKR